MLHFANSTWTLPLMRPVRTSGMVDIMLAEVIEIFTKHRRLTAC
jgi:hypothetical protein